MPGPPAVPGGGMDPDMLRTMLLLMQLLNLQGPPTAPGQGNPMVAQQPVPQIQLPQVGAAMGKYYGQQGNIYGQLADLFRDMSRPQGPPGLRRFERMGS